jgi:hypothetical protein
MKNSLVLCLRVLFALVLGLLVAPGSRASAAGVTLITHGLNGNVDGWITGMATNVPWFARFPGTNYACYQVGFVSSGGGYVVTATRVAGGEPRALDSGEVVLKLDWRDLADGNSFNTYQVAAAVLPALLSTNFISELGGHALAEFPLHLIGHSRGGSLVCELSRLLGTNGVWVDHLTTLDPHPLNDPAFPLDIFVGSAVDAPARTYANVLFHDNYWQDAAFGVAGLPVAGAYVRRLTSFNGGYGGLGHQHSDVHLWYHGTLDWRVPTTDSEASLTSAERTAWWVAYENRGTNAGFQYSRMGGATRTSGDQPLGFGTSAIRDGFNQNWDLGAGVAANRTALPVNSGDWPNLIQFNRVGTNAIEPGQNLPVQFSYQWAQSGTQLAALEFHLDLDGNPLNTNQTWLATAPLPGTAAGFVGAGATNLLVPAADAAPGSYAVAARFRANGRSRWMYAPERVVLLPATPRPVLALERVGATQFRIVVSGASGQTLRLEQSTHLGPWEPLLTNTLTGSDWVHTNTFVPGSGAFFRARRL